MDQSEDQTEDRPDARQLLHAATGDRDAEARAVAERDDTVTEADARTAVRGAHGDIPDGPDPHDDLATTDDVTTDAADRSVGG